MATFFGSRKWTKAKGCRSVSAPTTTAAPCKKPLETAYAPFLDAAEPLEGKIGEFIAHKVRQNGDSRDSVTTKRYILGRFAKFTNQREPAVNSTAEVEWFYGAQHAGSSESTAQGYMTTLRSFFSRLGVARKVRSNPVAQVKLARLDQKGESPAARSWIDDSLK